MNRKKSVSAAILVGILVLLIAPISVFAGTATATKNTGRRGGQNCGKISKKKRTNTGGMTVTKVVVDGKTLKQGTDYKVRAGTDGSTRPVIEFTNDLSANVGVTVTLDTIKDGEFDAVLTLTKCRN